MSGIQVPSRPCLLGVLRLCPWAGSTTGESFMGLEYKQRGLSHALTHLLLGRSLGYLLCSFLSMF